MTSLQPVVTLTLPIGLIMGRILVLRNGDGTDLSLGAHDLPERLDNAAVVDQSQDLVSL